MITRVMTGVFTIPLAHPGSLAIVLRPRGGDWLDDDVAAWTRCGITTIVSLLCEDEERELALTREAEACSNAGIQFVALPVRDLSAPRDDFGFVDAASRIAASIRAGDRVAAHCRQSVGRSGMLAVSVAIACGVPLESALALVSDARGVNVPETAEQLGWLRRHAAQLADHGGRPLV